MAHGIPARLTAREGRKFALVLAIGFGVLATVSALRGHQTPPLVLGGLALSIALAGVLVPGRLGPIYRGWMRIGLAMSKVTTPIILGIVYFLVITPIGLAMRGFGRNPVRHRLDAKGSYWRPRAPEVRSKDGMRRQF